MNKKLKEQIFCTAAIIIIIDQFIKIIISSKMTLNQEIEIIPDFLSLYYIKNSGAGFSILQNNTVVIVVLSLLFLYLLNKFIINEKNINKFKLYGYGLLIGGIVGNLIDRLLYHKVIDFISFQFGSYYFPIFNIADIAITVGVIIMIIGILKDDKLEIPKKDNSEKDIKIVKPKKTTPKKTTTKKKTTKKNTKKTK